MRVQLTKHEAELLKTRLSTDIRNLHNLDAEGEKINKIIHSAVLTRQKILRKLVVAENDNLELQKKRNCKCQQ